MVKIREAIVVEGRYDKNTLSQIVDATILETAGFGIFKDKAQMRLLRRAAEKRGLIVFTDADGAGFVIRNHIKSAIRIGIHDGIMMNFTAILHDHTHSFDGIMS
jgi:ribonuclease M5